MTEAMRCAALAAALALAATAASAQAQEKCYGVALAGKDQGIGSGDAPGTQHGRLPGRRLGHGAGGHLPDHGAAGAARRHAAARGARAAGPRPALTGRRSAAGDDLGRRRAGGDGAAGVALAEGLLRAPPGSPGRRRRAPPARTAPWLARSSTTLRQDQTSWLQKPPGTGPRRFPAAAAQTPVRQSACSASASPTAARLPRPAPISRSAAASSMPSLALEVLGRDPRRDQRQPEVLLPLQPPGEDGEEGEVERGRPGVGAVEGPGDRWCRRRRGCRWRGVKKTTRRGIVAVAGAVGGGAAPDRLGVGEGDLGAAHDRVGPARRPRLSRRSVGPDAAAPRSRRRRARGARAPTTAKASGRSRRAGCLASGRFACHPSGRLP